MTNPLLSFDGLPLFDRIQPEHVESALDELLTQASAALETVTTPEFLPAWGNIACTLDVAIERLSRAWGAVSHLNSVVDTPELRAAYNAALPKVTEFYTRLGADERLYAKYRAIDPASLNAEQRQALKNALRNFVLGGADLKGAARERFAAIAERQAALSQKFSENTLDATDAFAYYARADELGGLPEDVMHTALSLAQAEGKEGYKLTLKMPCYLPVMQFASNSTLRQTLYRAYVTRASDQAAGDCSQFDNSAIISELLALRLEEAQLLNYPNFGALSVAPKMADSPQQVVDFLRDLANRARPFAVKDLADLRTFAQEQLQLPDPQPWDWPYVSEKLKEARYAFNEQEVKPYFPLPKVLAGLFKIVETLFEVKILEDHAAVWHESVRFFRIQRNTVQGEAELVGQFYLDPQARNGKRGGAWMDDVRTRWLRPDTHQLQTPVAHLVCNFASGVNGKPALLTHDDVTTLFHEFGHGLHHMLSLVNERDVSGISGVEWDAVELPSQFMENFCWEREAVDMFARHYISGERIPDDLFQRMQAAKNFQSGMQMLRQIEFSLFDLDVHSRYRPDQGQSVQALLDGIRDRISVFKPPVFNRFQNSFSHIFAGGYGAGYYSYKWAEVLSADVFAAFEEEGITSRKTAERLRTEILSIGGSRDIMQAFVAFRGRRPQVDALLRHSGMQA